MSPDIVQVLIQLPIVLAFIYYTQYMNKQFQAFLATQREEDRKILDRLASQLERTEQMLNEHDKKTDMAITKMDERTRPTRAKKVTEEAK